jgi:hypothetical protein
MLYTNYLVSIIVPNFNHNFVYRKNLKRPNTSNHTKTNSYKNISEQLLTKALRIKRDGYVKKYTNPRKAETTTSEYIIQDLKQQAKKKLKIRLQNKQHKSTNYNNF